MDRYPYKSEADRIFFSAWGIPIEPEYKERMTYGERKVELARLKAEYDAKPKWYPRDHQGEATQEAGG